MRVGRLVGQMPALPSSVTCFWTWTWRHVDDGADGVEGDDEDGDHDDYYVEAIESCFAAALSCVPRYEASQGFASLNLQIDQHGNKEVGR